MPPHPPPPPIRFIRQIVFLTYETLPIRKLV
jgi:hypothetical protein